VSLDEGITWFSRLVLSTTASSVVFNNELFVDIVLVALQRAQISSAFSGTFNVQQRLELTLSRLYLSGHTQFKA